MMVCNKETSVGLQQQKIGSLTESRLVERRMIWKDSHRSLELATG